ADEIADNKTAQRNPHGAQQIHVPDVRQRLHGVRIFRAERGAKLTVHASRKAFRKNVVLQLAYRLQDGCEAYDGHPFAHQLSQYTSKCGDGDELRDYAVNQILAKGLMYLEQHPRVRIVDDRLQMLFDKLADNRKAAADRIPRLIAQRERSFFPSPNKEAHFV